MTRLSIKKKCYGHHTAVKKRSKNKKTSRNLSLTIHEQDAVAATRSTNNH